MVYVVVASRNKNIYFSVQGVEASHSFLYKKSQVATIKTAAGD